jgi:hypothetical protein
MTDSLEFQCDVCGKVVATEKGLTIHKTRLGHHAGDVDPADYPADNLPEAEPFEKAPIDPSPYDAEVAPEAPKGWRERVWGDGKAKGLKAATSERKPRKRRSDTSGVWVTLWTAAGLGLVRSGADIAVGNCLTFQAPIVGDILDEAVRDTFIDTLIQPIAGKGKKFKQVSSVLAMPVLVGVMERSPAAAPMLEPLLRQTIREHLVAMAPIIKQRQKEEEQYRKALDELGMEGGEDPIDAVLEAIFPQAMAAAHNGSKVHAS